MSVNRALIRGALFVGFGLAPLSASAATNFSISLGGGNSSSGTQVCAPIAGTIAGSSPVSGSTTCIGNLYDIGFGSASASAGYGDLGVDTSTASTTSIPAGAGAQAIFSDDSLIFTSNVAGATSADVAVNLLLDGTLNAAAPNGSAGADIAGRIQLGARVYGFEYIFTSDGVFTVKLDEFNTVSGVVGPGLDAFLRSPIVNVPLGTPVYFLMVLESSASSAGPLGSALSDFSGSFEFPSGVDVFTVPDGVTVNAGAYLVNNRFVASAPIPEPSMWMMLGAGFLALGAMRLWRPASGTKTFAGIGLYSPPGGAC
jgi:hypothetical protein